MENVFDALCSILAEPEIKASFLEAEGNELMVLIMKEKGLARSRSVKVLDFALQTEEGADNCVRFVESMGLKSLFNVFMGKVSLIALGIGTRTDDPGRAPRNPSWRHQLPLSKTRSTFCRSSRRSSPIWPQTRRLGSACWPSLWKTITKRSIDSSRCARPQSLGWSR